MSTADEFVTLLRTSDALYVDQIVAALRVAGIPCEHPGKNHAALIPGLTYIEIQLRVPRSQYEDAKLLLAELETIGPQTIAFRVKRERPFRGALVGFLLALMPASCVASVASELHPLAVLVGTSVTFAYFTVCGFILGKWPRGLLCSVPSCGRRVTKKDPQCPKCGATFRGTIASEGDHFAALEAIQAFEQDRASNK